MIPKNALYVVQKRIVHQTFKKIEYSGVVLFVGDFNLAILMDFPNSITIIFFLI